MASASRPEAAGDPFTTLSRVRAANTALEQLVQDRRRRPERERERAHLLAALADADRQVALARTLIADHPGQIGPQARTRLAQAERLLDGVTHLDDPTAALTQVRQAADLAAGAADLARADLTADVRHRQDAPPWAPGSGRGGAGSMLGGVLGGMVLGGILDGLDDIDLDFD